MWNLFRKIGCDGACGSQARRDTSARAPMQIDTQRSGVEGRQALRQQSACHSRQHIASARRRQRGIGRPVEVDTETLDEHHFEQLRIG